MSCKKNYCIIERLAFSVIVLFQFLVMHIDFDNIIKWIYTYRICSYIKEKENASRTFRHRSSRLSNLEKRTLFDISLIYIDYYII